MNTYINNNFEKYKDDFWKGLSLRETIWGAIAMIVGVSLILFFIFYLQWNTYISVFISIPFVTVIGFNGFFSKNKMTLAVYMKKKIHIVFGKPLVIKECDIRKEKIRNMEQLILEQRKQTKKGRKSGKDKI